MYTPLVSVVIPLYNREQLVIATLDSLVKQTYSAWEAIVVDDGSSDNSFAVVSKMSNIDNRIRLIRRYREPKGASTCRNIGMQNSRGEYLIFLDSDDLLAPFCLETRVHEMSINNDLDFAVFPGVRCSDEPSCQDCLISTYRGGDVFPLFLNLDVPWVNLNPIYRKQKLSECKIRWDERLMGYQDIQFHVEVVSHGLKYRVFDTKPDCFWRKHESGNIGAMLFNKVESLESHILLIKDLHQGLVRAGQLSEINVFLLNNFIFTIAESAGRLFRYKLQFRILYLFKELKLLNRKTEYYRLIFVYFINILNVFLSDYVQDLLRKEKGKHIVVLEKKTFLVSAHSNEIR